MLFSLNLSVDRLQIRLEIKNIKSDLGEIIENNSSLGQQNLNVDQKEDNMEESWSKNWIHLIKIITNR